MLKSLPTKVPVASAFFLGSNNRLDIRFISPYGHHTECRVECSVDQYTRWLNGEPVEKAFPLLDKDMQELFRTGCGPKESKRYYADT